LNLASSKREARTFIQQGAIYVNNDKVENIEQVIDLHHTYEEKYIIIRRGKKKYALIIGG
jgi:tyrosyl-tRNA synthetase